jgi:2-polyprenyl-6-methoxyphenol hydroxylase-like FAD-dependent oxidoreductase
MSRRINNEVLVVGGGPVGLSLAMDLARRGVGVTLAETRAAAEPSSVRCNYVSARTMEIFRRLGVAGAVRDAGLPADYPNDVAFRTTATGIEMARIPIPCHAERYNTTDGPDTWWPTPEPPHRINQIYPEPVLFAYAAVMPGLRILNRTRVLDFVQPENEVLAIGLDLESGLTLEILARYLVGCDGRQRSSSKPNRVMDMGAAGTSSQSLRSLEPQSCEPLSEWADIETIAWRPA